jgi:hypothetical protein
MIFGRTNTKTMILESDAPTCHEYYPVFHPFHRCSDNTVPIRFDRTFHKSFFMNGKTKKKGTSDVLVVAMLILLLTVQSCAHLTSSELAAIIIQQTLLRLPKGTICET